MKEKFYQETGDINYLNLGIGLLLSFIVSCIVGYLYAVTVHIIPIIYFNIIIAFFFGVTLSIALRVIFKLIKSQSKTERLILIISTVIFANYCQWIAFLSAISYDSFPTPTEYFIALDYIFTPIAMFNFIGLVNEYGTWGIGSSGSSVNGWLLTIIWIAEILVIAFTPLMLIAKIKIYPFSNKYNKWYPKFTLNTDFEVINSENSIVPKLDENVIETIQGLKLGNGHRHSKIHLYYLEGEEYQYLSLDRVVIEDRGKGNKNAVSIIQNYRIPTITAKEIQANFRMTKEKVDII